MSILDTIITHKRSEIALKKSIISVTQLENSDLFNSKTNSLSKSILNSPFGIIAEHKRRSPSKNNINNNFSVEEVVKGYEDAGASGISVLTDTRFFGGSSDDLLLARAAVQVPILRKEFIIDEYQLLEAKSYGADAILLIAACLTTEQIKQLSKFALSLALEVILEVHNLTELEKNIMPSIDIIGVNNRNLKTFDVSLQNSIDLIKHIPKGFTKISESGIAKKEDLQLLQSHGFDGFLIGEKFMQSNNPGKSLEQFINDL